MTATATPLPMSASSLELLEPSLYQTIKANTKIPAGTLAMRIQGNDYVEPYVEGTIGTILMGVAERTYDNLGNGSAKVYPNGEPMVFRRGCMNQFKTDGTITPEDHVMTLVGLKDNQTIGATIASHGCSALLVAIDKREPGVTVYRVLIAQSGPTT